MRCNETAEKKSTVTDFLFVIAWDVRRLQAEERGHGHFPAVMKHDETAWWKKGQSLTTVSFMEQDMRLPDIKWGTDVTHLLLVMGLDVMKLSDRKKGTVCNHSLLTTWWNAMRVPCRKRGTVTHILFAMVWDMIRLPGKTKGTVTHTLLVMGCHGDVMRLPGR